MPQTAAWEREYQNPQLVTKDSKPQKDVVRFFKFLKKTGGISLTNLNVLDLGCGVGRNTNHLAMLGNIVTGFEISKTALAIAKTRASELGVSVDYRLQNIGSAYPLEDNTFDLVLDITSSNALNEEERAVHLSEVHRVLKPEGYFFVRALCKDGDTNAKALIKKNPGKERDTYINTAMNLTERVFTQEDFKKLYSAHFSILQLSKKTGYTSFGGRSYKRNFWLAYMQKKSA